jgi:NAD dependent epimerase/dehydratase family enzyme
VLPERLLEAGFEFEYPTIGAALAAELGADPRVNVTASGL